MDYTATTPAQAKNVRRTENQRFNAEWEVTGKLAMKAVLRRDSRNSSQGFRDFRANMFNVNARFSF